MLFSEPKIPQFPVSPELFSIFLGFSALQRAENSSINTEPSTATKTFRFQCSSASRKFLNECFKTRALDRCASFSALQRAENSSICQSRRWQVIAVKFQCSSASRKFLNFIQKLREQLFHNVSVLFSEPKIPQSRNESAYSASNDEFQCSSASRKFLNLVVISCVALLVVCFSALQRAENSSIRQRLYSAT